MDDKQELIDENATLRTRIADMEVDISVLRATANAFEGNLRELAGANPGEVFLLFYGNSCSESETIEVFASEESAKAKRDKMRGLNQYGTRPGDFCFAQAYKVQ